MKHTLSRLVPLLLPACMVDTPVVEGEERDQDRLGAGLAAWCDSMCARYDECEPNNVDIEACPSSCTRGFSERYAGKTAVCTEAGLRLMDCLERASCAELTSGEACESFEEAGRCAASQGEVICRSGEGNSGGSAGYGGSGSPPVPQSCDLELSDCSDGRDYGVSCTGFGENPVCECSVYGYVTGRFSPNETSCPERSGAIQVCGWPVTVDSSDPEVPPLVDCLVRGGDGAAGGGNVADCGADFTECSDGRKYAVDCDGSVGAVTCTCYVDDEPIGYHQSAAGICPFVFDPDGAAVAANYTCGFRIAPVTEL